MKKFISVLLTLICIAAPFTLCASATECLEHQYTATVVAPTCVESGYTLNTCQKCGKFFNSDTTNPLRHSYGQWQQVDEVSCTQEGLEQRNCQRCTAFETKTVPVLPHTDVDYDGKCDICGTDVDVEQIFSPFDWLKAFFKAIVEWFRAIFA